MMDEAPSPPETTTTPPAAPYTRILNMAEGRRRQLFGWLNERCVYIPQLDPTPPEDLSALTAPAPIEYARACGGGSTDAWLLVLHDMPRPYIIVPEDSLAADYVVRYQMLQEVPAHAVPVVSGQSGAVRPAPASIRQPTADPREEVLGPRRVTFTVESLPPHDPREDDPYYGGDEYEEDSAASIQDIIVSELQELAYVMAEDAQWVVPLVEEELWKAYEAGQIGPDLTGGLMMVGANAPLGRLRKLDDGDDDEVDAETLLDADGVLHTTECYDDDDDDLRGYTPYENPGALLRGSTGEIDDETTRGWSEHERRRRAEQERLRENIARGFQTFLSYLHISDPPPPRAQSHSAVTFAGDPVANGTEDPEAQQQQHANLEEGGAADPGLLASDQEKSVRFLDPNCIQRAISETERQLTDGRWCLMTLHEFQAWRCEAQSPLIEASLLNVLALEASAPKWLLNPLEDRAASGAQRARAVSDAVRAAKPRLVAMADALERFLATARDASLYRGPQNTGDMVHVDAVLWGKIRGAAEQLVEAHGRCFFEERES